MDDLCATNSASYDRIAAAYATRNAGMPPSVLKAAGHLITYVPAGGRILDIGCGTGRDSAWFASPGFRVAGFDLSAGMLREASQRTRCPCVRGDMLRLPFLTRSFDALWCNAALLHVPKTQAPACLSGFRRILKPGGVLFLALKAGSGETWEPESYGLDAPRFFARYSFPEGAELLEGAGFRVIEQAHYAGASGVTWLHYFAG